MSHAIIRPPTPRAPTKRTPGRPDAPRAFACRRCGARVPAGPLAAVAAGTATQLVFDRACPGCGQRALYHAEDRVA